MEDIGALASLQGRELIQVCIGQYQVILNFTQELSLMMEGKYLLKEKNTEVKECTVSNIMLTKELVNLLGTSIVDIRLRASNNLIICFSDGCTLELISDQTGMESYYLRYQDFELVR